MKIREKKKLKNKVKNFTPNLNPKKKKGKFF